MLNSIYLLFSLMIQCFTLYHCNDIHYIMILIFSTAMRKTIMHRTMKLLVILKSFSSFDEKKDKTKHNYKMNSNIPRVEVKQS